MNSNKLVFSFFFLCLWQITGCSSDNFPDYQQLTGLRVLAVTATNGGGFAEASPGDTVTITPYVSDIDDVGTVNATAVACVDPGIAYGATVTCNGNPTAVALANTSWVAPMTDVAPSFTVNIPATILLGQSAMAQYNGVNYLVIYTLISPTGFSLTTVKRIPVSSKPTKNSNPGAFQVLSNGAALGALPPTVLVNLSVVPAAGSQETYTSLDSGGNLITNTETLTATWFITDGTLEYVRTDPAQLNQYSAPASYPNTRPSYIITVLRDNRGGEAVVRSQIN